jgi:predicted amidohydrolase YtcJ
LRAGARFANGSDFPIEDVNPMLGIFASITRRDLNGELPDEGWHPEETLTPQEALASWTRWGAWLAFREADLGVLAPGMQADFVVLDRDPIAGPAERIPETRVLRTVVSGETVFEAGAA